MLNPKFEMSGELPNGFSPPPPPVPPPSRVYKETLFSGMVLQNQKEIDEWSARNKTEDNMIKRYGIRRCEKVIDEKPTWTYERTEDGEWVKWEDIEHLMTVKSDDVPVCNCMKKLKWEPKAPALTWICPAHGYKRR